MKILINGKYGDVGFLSFLKCNILTSLALMGIVYGIVAILMLLGSSIGL
jgi:hypothetical protein